MSDLIWLSDAQMRRIERHFPRSHGVPRVDDRRIVSGIIFVIRNGLAVVFAPCPTGPWRTRRSPSSQAWRVSLAWELPFMPSGDAGCRAGLATASSEDDGKVGHRFARRS
jgi:transposase